MNKNKRVVSFEEQQSKRIKSQFKRKIRNVFTGAGFTYIPTNDHEMTIGFRAVEVDALFIYQNIWLICEDTIKTTNIREHIRTKNEAFGQIKENLGDYIDALIGIFPEKEQVLRAFDAGRIKVFGLYISREELDISEADHSLFPNLIFVQPRTLNYFQWTVKCIKLSARNEIFRFLNLSDSDIGSPRSTSSSAEITAPIIYPKEFTGLTNRVRIVSFMMSAEDMLDMCYVLRKDNWDESIWLYQRLIDKQKIRSIRAFLETKGEAFYNNIIVALPDDVMFKDTAHQYRTVDEISPLESNCQLVLPKKMNSICIIDGQHRVFAHYESGNNSKQEMKIAALRKQLHLLVTGLIFPSDMSKEERIRYQSAIFLDINTTAKPVPQNVLLHIKRIKNPIEDESLAQFVIESLNREGIFKNMFQLSFLETGRIKTASIVRFALRYLVTIAPSDGKQSLFEYWDGDKEAIKSMKEEAIKSYATFCATILRSYFGAIRKHMKQYWDDESSKLLSVISINGFIIAFTRQLRINGVKDFDFYDKIFSSWSCDFSAENFPYTSSQYRKFSTKILSEAFMLTDKQLQEI